MAAGLGVLLLTAGCSGSASSTPAPTGGQPTGGGSTTPKVDRVIVAMPPPANEGNNPNVELSILTMFPLRPMLGWLIDYTVKGDLAPMLATSWTIEPDGKSWRLQLRKGVKFHGDNGEFTAKDVEYSFNEMIRQDSTHSHAPLHRVVTLEVVNDYEVVFHHKTPNAEYLAQLARGQGGISMVSKKDGESMGKKIGRAHV